jgi:hypothetical protein
VAPYFCYNRRIDIPAKSIYARVYKIVGSRGEACRNKFHFNDLQELSAIIELSSFSRVIRSNRLKTTARHHREHRSIATHGKSSRFHPRSVISSFRCGYSADTERLVNAEEAKRLGI